MQTSTIQAIAAALALRPLTRAELVHATGLSLLTISRATHTLNLVSDGRRPARYSLPAGPLLSISDPAADLVPRPWHAPLEDRRDRYRNDSTTALLANLQGVAIDFSNAVLDPKYPESLDNLLTFLPKYASGLLALTERMEAASKHPDWYERLGGTLDIEPPAQ